MFKLIDLIKKNIRRLRMLLFRRAYISRDLENNIVDNFTRLYRDSYYFGQAWNTTTWLGHHVHKCPNDLWMYQEIIFNRKPDVIIEAGTSRGGSALFMANMCDLVGKGKIITIDIKVKNDKRPKHDRITYLLGSSTSDEIVEKIKTMVKPDDKVMVVLDSRHHKYHVIEELKIYQQFIKVGDYMIVEDSFLNGHPVDPTFGPGPMEAIEEFLKEDKRFVSDRDMERHFLTFNPKGYLKRVK